MKDRTILFIVVVSLAAIYSYAWYDWRTRAKAPTCVESTDYIWAVDQCLKTSTCFTGRPDMWENYARHKRNLEMHCNWEVFNALEE